MSQSPFSPPSAEEMSALLPAFQFTGAIASGPSGAVYFANQKSLDRQVAIKLFSPALGKDAAFSASIDNASRAMAGLRHPNMIGLFDSGRVEGMPYWVMEFVPGKSLARSTRGQVIDFAQAMGIIDAVCDGLAHAHEKGLVHGHLDTLSILLNQNAVPKIGNFGLGRTIHTDPAADDTSHFTAPEVLADPMSATKRSDVYSVAAMFYGLITGRAYTQDSPPASGICKCRPAVDAVLKRATDPDPAKRHEDAAAFQKALKEAAEPARKIAPAQVSPNPAPAATPAPLPPAGVDTKLLAKLAIIVVLLIAIFFTWETMKKVRAERHRQNAEILAKQEAAKKAARALIEEQEALEGDRVRVTRPQEHQATTDTGREQEKETPESSLERLRSTLAAGARSEMPVGTVRKNDRDYFLVKEEKTWAEACLFAEEHGAHLAVPSSDLGWLDSELTSGRECWLGAARNGNGAWVLCDGKPWTPAQAPSGSGLFLVTAKGGGFSSADEGEKRPFVIEWHTDGLNPGTLAGLLANTNATLNTPSPVYPPGTIVSGERRYLPVIRPMDWQKAKQLAESGGGHLLVASGKEEIAELAGLTKNLKAKEGLWLGGSLEGDLWTWSNGEPWLAGDWKSGADATEEGLALVIIPGKGWDGRDREEEASGFLIEWSADAKSAPSAESSPSAAAQLADLDAKVKELLATASKKREDEHASNIKKFRWDLDSFLRNLSRSAQDQFADSVSTLKEHVSDNRLNVDELRAMAQGGEILVSPEMLKLIIYHTDKQGQVDSQADAGIAKIRDAYVDKVDGIRAAAEASGQLKLAETLKEKVDDAADLSSWTESVVEGD